MRQHMAGKVVLVTGCSAGGLGHALCKAFAAAGCKVYASAPNITTMQGLEALGCTLLELDVTNTGSIHTAVQRVLADAGSIDVVVNNAGLFVKGWAIEVPVDAVRRLVEVNFLGMIATNQAAAPHMIQRRCGTIVNIGSSTAYVAIPQASAYAASKHAVRAYSDALRVELSPFDVHVMHVAPGFMKTLLFGKNGVIVQPPADSPYTQFKHATRELMSIDSQNGIGGLAATDPSVLAARIVERALRQKPPRHYLDGWLSWPLYLVGCYLPCWLQDLLHKIRLGLFQLGSQPRHFS